MKVDSEDQVTVNDYRDLRGLEKRQQLLESISRRADDEQWSSFEWLVEARALRMFSEEELQPEYQARLRQWERQVIPASC